MGGSSCGKCLNVPGNLMSFAGMSSVWRRARIADDCVDFPERSKPSMTTNAPRFAPALVIVGDSEVQ